MGIASSTGLASGLNVDSIISQLTAIDSKAMQTVNNQKSGYQQKISAYGTLLNALSSFKDATVPLETNDALGLQAVSSNTSVLTATATASASPGSYRIKVNQTAQAESIYSKNYAAPTDAVGTGTLTIQVGNSTPVNIAITNSNNTLSGIKDAINQANAGVTASVLNDGTGYRLTLSSNTTGASNIIKVSAADDDGNNTDMNGLSALAYDSSNNIANMTQSLAPKDAQMVLNGITVTRSTNTITDLLNGVTLNLNGFDTANTLNLTVSNNTQGLINKVTAFVAAYNQTMAVITGTGVAGTPNNNGPIYGENLVNGISDSMRNITTDAYANNSLALIGVTHDKNGVLQLDSNMLSSAVASNPQGVMATINAMSSALDTTLTNYINISIPNQEDSYNSTIASLTDKVSTMQEQLNNETTNLRSQFAALETTLSQLQSEGNFITQAFSAWNPQPSGSSGK